MDTTKTITHIGLCAGYGGIELGLKRAIPTLRTVALCEIEAFACANLVAKMEAGLMDAAPIWTNLKTFPWSEFRDKVDILTGGYPCQPFSAAGKRLGTEDPRHLWPFIADGIRILRPKLCFFENVEGHISLGLREVISELESIGYKAAWGIFSASEVGAPHQRKRVFILAHRISEGSQGCLRPLNMGLQGEAQSLRPAGPGGLSAWPSRPGELQHGWEPPRVVGTVAAKLANFCSRDSQSGGDTAQTSCESVGAWREGADPNAHGGSSFCGGDQGDEQAGTEGLAHTHGCGGEEPEHKLTNLPTEPSGGNAEAMGDAKDKRKLNEAEQNISKAGALPYRASEGAGESVGNTTMLNGTGQARGLWATQAGRTDTARHIGQAQPPLGGDADGPASGMDYAELCITCDNRTDELRLLGNGVVPATAERAFRVLMEELKTPFS